MRKQRHGRVFGAAAICLVIAACVCGLLENRALACPACTDCGEAGPCTELQYFLYGDCYLNFGNAKMGELPEENQNRTVSFIVRDR